MNTITNWFVSNYVPGFVNSEAIFEAKQEHPNWALSEMPSHSHDASREATWPRARKHGGNDNDKDVHGSDEGTTVPQVIAHRGFKARLPENTMAAFKGAVAAGTDAFETDIHLTKDGVVVLSHDGTLKRCFGIDKKLKDCEWSYVSTLLTLEAPHEPMPRLADLLKYMSTPKLSSLWVLLDIKLDDDAETMMRLLAESIASVPPDPSRPWRNRIMLGTWALKYLPFCKEFLPDFPIAHIGVSTSYARLFFPYPNVSFNMFFHSLLVPCLGRQFLRDARARGRAVFAWTVNDEKKMRWCIREGLDGVITDDPARFVRARGGWVAERRKGNGSSRRDSDDGEDAAARDKTGGHLGLGNYVFACWVWALSWMFHVYFDVRLSRKTRRLVNKRKSSA